MRKIVAAGVLLLSLAGAKASSAQTQTQYPITPPVVLQVVDPSSPPVVTPTPAATVLGAAPASSTVPASTAPSGTPVTVAPAAVAEKPVAEVLGQTITAVNTPAFTGSSTTKPLAAAGLSLVAAGFFFVVATRRRRSAPKPVR